MQLRKETITAFIISMVVVLAGCGARDSQRSSGTGGGTAEQRAQVAEARRAAGSGEGAAPAPADDSAAGEAVGSEYWLGEPRTDLDRFYGLYGDAANPDEGHGQFFVKQAERPIYAEQAPEIPPGYLEIGAMWGDVAPWYFKSVSDSEFVQVSMGDFGPPEPIAVEFELGQDGKAKALTFATVFDEFGRRERLGDLPEEWR